MIQKLKSLTTRVAVVSLLMQPLLGAELHVDNLAGSDANPGTREAPYQTIAAAMKQLKGGDTLHMTAHEGRPYQETIDSHPAGRWGGTSGQPTVIDGHGATMTGLKHLKSDQWQAEGEGIFRRHLSNNAWAMDQQGYWSGFPIVFFDNRPAEFCRDKQSLREFTYFLHKDPPKEGAKRDTRHNTLYIKLPAGKTPDDVKVESIALATMVHISASNVTVRNLTCMYAGHDGFATTNANGLVFDNVRAAYCMDQGISNHGAKAVVKNSRFDHNANCGIVDVYPNCNVKYLDCLIEENIHRGGVEFYSGEYEMENCIIRNNERHGLVTDRGAKVALKNCLIAGRGGNAPTVELGAGELSLTHCTLRDGSAGFSAFLAQRASKLEIVNCAFLGNSDNLRLNKPPTVEIGMQGMRLERNIYTPAPFNLFGRVFKASDWDAYRQASGFDTGSVMREVVPAASSRAELQIGGTEVGADIQGLEQKMPRRD